MNRVNNGKILSWATGFCIAIAMGSTVHAQTFEMEDYEITTPYDAKTYPGIACEAQAVTEIDQFSNIAFDMVNADNGKRTVVCPIVRDNIQNTDGTYGAYVNVNNPANRTTECTLYSYDKFGSLIDSNDSSESDAGDHTIVLDVDVSAEGGFYGITCTLPLYAVVRSYEVREFLSTDDEGGLDVGGAGLVP